MSIALIDGDVLQYTVGFSVEQKVYTVSEGGHSLSFTSRKALYDFIESCSQELIDRLKIEEERVVEPLSHCFYNLEKLIDSIIEKTGAIETRIYLSGKNNFREKIATIQKYKGNRDPEGKPHYFYDIRSRLQDKYWAIVTEGQEADDALGIASTLLQQRGYDPIICSIDKDMKMIPGKHYNMQTGKLFEVTEEEGIKFFYTQLLTGDPVDNIRGVFGVGPKKAEKILKDAVTEKELFDLVLKEYQKGYKDKAEEALLENGRLLWIRRNEEEMWGFPT